MSSQSKKDTKAVAIVKNGHNGHTPAKDSKSKLLELGVAPEATKSAPVTVEFPVALSAPKPTISQETRQITMEEAHANKIRAFEASILGTKAQLADLEMQLLDGHAKKQEMINLIRAQNVKMMEEVRAIAQSYGIDVDGVTDDRTWNLNTQDMVFYRVK